MTRKPISDLPERLRCGRHRADPITLGGVEHDKRCLEAADEIERLRAENARLRCLMTKAHAVMRAHGWQLAPASEAPEGGHLLALAAAEIESEFGAVLGGFR